MHLVVRGDFWNGAKEAVGPEVLGPVVPELPTDNIGLKETGLASKHEVSTFACIRGLRQPRSILDLPVQGSSGFLLAPIFFEITLFVLWQQTQITFRKFFSCFYSGDSSLKRHVTSLGQSHTSVVTISLIILLNRVQGLLVPGPSFVHKRIRWSWCRSWRRKRLPRSCCCHRVGKLQMLN